MNATFKALADETRRKLLDALYRNNGQTLTDLCGLVDMSRQAVTKHLYVLESANLVTTVWDGREKRHYLNPVPIHEIAERWIDKYERQRLQALSDLKKGLEKKERVNSMKKNQLVYVTFIRTTPKKLWDAITKPEFARQYWAGNGNISDWKKGSNWQHVKEG